MPAAPPGPQQSIVKVWARVWEQVAGDVEDMAALMLDDRVPLPVGEQRRLATIMNQIRALRRLDPHGVQVAAYLWDRLDVGSVEAERIARGAMAPWGTQAAESAASLAGGFDLVNDRAVSAVVREVTGAMSRDFAEMTVAAQRRMVADLVTAVSQGDGARDFAKRIMRSIEPQFGTAQSRSLRIARTQLARAYDLARFEVYAEAAAEGLVTGWEWVANGSNVCDICQALDGTIWPVDEDTYRHPNCVCSTVPVLADSPQADIPFGGQDPDSRFADVPTDGLTRVTSPSGWTHWQLRDGDGVPAPLRDNPVASAG